ncbi:hypothetical protein [Hymenobacter psychrotolerans]|uniref:Uncharacterized protein n=1 Tax=Hymenobacter psychrotolerans DSM 18569 TaxID=1121959 RepID=A0A1M6YGU2_9BACT|nr:hypothetical protein [Hymenobacter psychrotolerans]SHL17531.1 hypothetical protein SAMN02746009_02251 [Hymenobacter psychrotolerans DSM 18569]
MIFTETLNNFHSYITDTTDLIFDIAFKNQKHESDLFLLIENGFYNRRNPDVVFGNTKISPYTIGFDDDRLSEQTQNEFYNFYRDRQIPNKHTFQKSKVENKTTQHTERISIHIETALYIKFWESEHIIRLLHNLARLSNKQDFNWHFDSSNFKITNKTSGKSQKLGRTGIIESHLISEFDNSCPEFSDLIQSCYSSQIRNSIAHSQFFLYGDFINFTNHQHGLAYNNISQISFERWELYIHFTILIYNAIISNVNRYYRMYCDRAKSKHFGIPIRIIKADHSVELRWYTYDGCRWCWYINSDQGRQEDRYWLNK